MQTVPKIAAKTLSMPDFGSFDLPRMKVENQKPVELALLLIIAIFLPIAIALQV